MDLVFKRYSNPFFLNACIENANLSEFVDLLIKKQDEEKLWEMYLATLPQNEKSFNDWKKEISVSNKRTMTNNMSRKEIDATIQKSQEILRGFKPPQKGGI